MSRLAESESISHPELELRMKLVGNEYSLYSSYVPDSTSLDILEIYPGGRVMEKVRLGCDDFADYCTTEVKDVTVNAPEESVPLLRVFFLEDLFIPPAIDDSTLPANTVTPPNMSDSTAQLLHRYFGVPMLFLRDLIPVITYRTIGNATFIRRNAEGKKLSIDGYYQLCSNYTANKVSYTWFSQSLDKGKASNYLIHKCPGVAKRLIMECAKGTNPLLLARPFALDAFLMNDCVMRMNNEMIVPRQNLIKIEQTSCTTNSHQTAQQVRNVTILHKIAREFRLMRDTLYSVKDTMDYMVDVQKQHSAALISVDSDGMQNRDPESIEESFSVMKSKASWITRELSSLEDRAALKIDLEYSIENQHDSRTNLRIARLTTNIAAASQKDSSSMITMAAVTMFFLPGTFVSAVFSMVFFTTSGGGSGEKGGTFRVAPFWWLFPAITIPLTILVFLVWIVWQRRRNIIGIKELEALAEDVEMDGIRSEPPSSFAHRPGPAAETWSKRLSAKLFGRWRSAEMHWPNASVFSGDDKSSFVSTTSVV